MILKECSYSLPIVSRELMLPSNDSVLEMEITLASTLFFIRKSAFLLAGGASVKAPSSGLQVSEIWDS